MAQGVAIQAPVVEGQESVLNGQALEFVAGLARRFEAARQVLLAQRRLRQAALEQGTLPDFLLETAAIRNGDWTIRALPPILQDRRVEITGPPDRKMMINALNSGARVFMADFEDANSPTWHNIVTGHVNLTDAIEGTIEFSGPGGKTYRLNAEPATLMVRPRGWHMIDKHVLVDGLPVSGSLLDFGLYFFNNARRLINSGAGAFFYLPKLENHLEARLWNDVFVHAQAALGLPTGTIKATVLIETILAAFEMDEILYELKDHSAGLNAGRWDYIFSIIKKFRTRPDFVLPDRAQVAMTVPFMRAYTDLLVKTSHRRGAPAIGGMAAFIPSRTDPDINTAALSKVRADKLRESADGFDGTWVAHPDLVTVARAVFDQALGSNANQLEKKRADVAVSASQLLDVGIQGASISERGLRANVSVTLRYLMSWLRGAGAAAIDNLMEDAATAEIARSQIWQWRTHGAAMSDGRPVSRELIAEILDQEVHEIRAADGARDTALADALRIFESVVLGPTFIEFLTIPAYDYLERSVPDPHD
ncbi:MAG: malate synthase A [Candidatus Eremiobacteraeota bacterium]|nr:malate synthase A [Candidatus Eremiobacteraeota bacterium]